MNRIILVGNGFDLAHGLKTGYKDFMNWYWKDFARKYPESNGGVPYEDGFAKFENKNGPRGEYDAWQGATYDNDPDCEIFRSFAEEVVKIESYTDLKNLIEEANEKSNLEYTLSFKNNFFGHISEKSYLGKWVDIENEYYCLLKNCLNKDEDRNKAVKELNKEFCQVKDLLEKYLTEVCEKEVTKIDSIKNAIEANIRYRDIAISKTELFDDIIKNIRTEYGADPNFKIEVNGELDGISKYRIRLLGVPPKKTLFLNFNYTKTTEKLYIRQNDDFLINIHGELNNKENPIIFGYGDELDDDYREIEKINDKNFLENIKSIQYHNTSNYRWLLEFMQDKPFQVFIAGHSCGNSDRTLLNTIFEHSNCISIKTFYWDKGNGSDDYTDIIKNISRNFTNKQNMRDIVVNKKICKPLIPLK